MRDRPNDRLHRRIAEAKIGRKLKPTEVVDHLNEDKTDQSPANLAVKRRGPHTAQHNQTRGLSKLRSSLRMVHEKRKAY